MCTCRVYFSSDFVGFFNEFLRKIPFIKCIVLFCNYYHFRHKTYLKCGKFIILHTSIWRAYRIIIFLPILIGFFSWSFFNWELLVCRPISSISYGFGNKFNRKGPTKAEFQNLNFIIFHPILMQFLDNDHLYWLLMDHTKFAILFSKRGSNFEFSHIWKAFLSLETVKQENCPKCSWSNKLLFPAYYCV
jgi:hypothetical protein